MKKIIYITIALFLVITTNYITNKRTEERVKEREKRFYTALLEGTDSLIAQQNNAIEIFIKMKELKLDPSTEQKYLDTIALLRKTERINTAYIVYLTSYTGLLQDYIDSKINKDNLVKGQELLYSEFNYSLDSIMKN